MDAWDDECHAFLLRVWPVKEDGTTSWHASLQPVGSESPRGFETLDALLAYLHELVEAPPVAPGTSVEE